MAPLLRELPKERILDEWKKLLLKSEKPSLGLCAGMTLGILHEIHPELPPLQETPLVSEELRQEWGDAVVWDRAIQQPAPLTRDAYGRRYFAEKIDAALEGSFTVRLHTGEEVAVRPVFDLTQSYILDNFDPDPLLDDMMMTLPGTATMPS